MSQDKDRAMAFVSLQIETFLRRHREKLLEIHPEKEERDIILESGNQEAIDAMLDMERLEEEIIKAIEQHDQRASIYNEDFGQMIRELIKKENETRIELLHKMHQDFEYRIRRAIGLVELVSTAEAFAVLDACRDEIEAMNK